MPIREVLDLIPQEMGIEKEEEMDYFRRMRERYGYLLRTVSEFNTGGPVVEVGSRPYQMTVALKLLEYDVVGIDVDPSQHRDLIAENNLDVLQADLNQDTLPLESDTAGIVVFSEVFEHLTNPINALQEINRILKPSGRLLLTTPNLYRLESVFRFVSGRGFDEPYSEFEQLDRLGHLGHVRLYTRGQLEQFLKQTGFEISMSSYNTFGGSTRPVVAPVPNTIYRIVPIFRPYVSIVATPTTNNQIVK